MDENCTTCFYGEFASLKYLSDLIGQDCYKCLHPNSPYYEEIVSDKISCRLYMDYNEYIKLKDRKESILKLKNKYR